MVIHDALPEEVVKLHVPSAGPLAKLKWHHLSVIEMQEQIDIVEDGPPFHPIDALDRNDAPVPSPPGPPPNANVLLVEKRPPEPEHPVGETALQSQSRPTTGSPVTARSSAVPWRATGTKRLPR
jgi:hypothetical protein